MEITEPEESEISIEKIHKYGIPFEEILARFTPEEHEQIEREARYYILRMELRKQRQSKGLTQQQLADKVNMPRTMITKIESGKRNVTVSTLMDIARALGKNLVVGFE